MTEFIERIESNPKAQKYIEVFVNKSSNQSSIAQYQTGKMVIIQKNYS